MMHICAKLRDSTTHFILSGPILQCKKKKTEVALSHQYFKFQKRELTKELCHIGFEFRVKICELSWMFTGWNLWRHEKKHERTKESYSDSINYIFSESMCVFLHHGGRLGLYNYNVNFCIMYMQGSGMIRWVHAIWERTSANHSFRARVMLRFAHCCTITMFFSITWVCAQNMHDEMRVWARV